MTDKAEPTNKFREEIEKQKLIEAKTLELDARVEYLQRRTVKELNEMDIKHLQSLIEKINEHTNRLFELPNSPAREFYLKSNQEQISQLKKQISAIAIKRADIVILTMLEEKFGKQTEKEPEKV